MKAITIIFLLHILACTSMVQAQNSNESESQDGVLLNQIDVDKQSLFILSHQEYSVQPLVSDFKDVMETLRLRVSNAEVENYALMQQDGNNNIAELTQKGKRNAAEITQMGNSNVYQGTINGEDNLLHILQTGSYNKIYQTLAGDNIELQVVQQGSGHELIQIETSGDAPNYKVEQKGEGMRIIIEHGIATFPYGNP